jgi:D-glycero-D-manno-heptose 1,7-bisphosphate phosphatase
MNKAFFLDRDGVINAAIWNATENTWDTPYSLDDFVMLPGVAEAIVRIRELGYLSVVISNQPGVAKAKCSLAYLDETKAHLSAVLAARGASLDGIYYCIHHPQATVPEYLLDCDCRKPKPGLLLQAARDLDIDLAASWMLGDMERDVEAGIAAGCRTVRIDAAPDLQTKAMLAARSLPEAVDKVALWLRNPDNAATRSSAR